MSESSKKTDKKLHWIFFFGSCSPKSVKKDTHCNPLQLIPGIVKGYVRCWSGYSNKWNGATASIRKYNKKYDSIYGNNCPGWIALFNNDDLNKMDIREGEGWVYDRIKIDVEIIDDNQKTVTMNVWTYIKRDKKHVSSPSLAYKKACLETKIHFWNKTFNKMVIRNSFISLYMINKKTAKIDSKKDLIVFDILKMKQMVLQTHEMKFNGIKMSESKIFKWNKKKWECIGCTNNADVSFVKCELIIPMFMCGKCQQKYGIKLETTNNDVSKQVELQLENEHKEQQD